MSSAEFFFERVICRIHNLQGVGHIPRKPTQLRATHHLRISEHSRSPSYLEPVTSFGWPRMAPGGSGWLHGADAWPSSCRPRGPQRFCSLFACARQKAGSGSNGAERQDGSTQNPPRDTDGPNTDAHNGIFTANPGLVQGEIPTNAKGDAKISVVVS
jgi:hypothetical protein